MAKLKAASCGCIEVDVDGGDKLDVGDLNHVGDKRGRDAVDGEISDKEASDRIARKYEIVTSRRRRNSSDTRFSSSRILLAFLLAVTFVPPVYAEDE